MTRTIRASAIFLGVTVIFLHAGTARAGDWLQFRGPDGSGISRDTQPLPVKWSETENLKWKHRLPGPGSSSPILVGNRVLVTCWTGYGLDRADPGEQKDLYLVPRQASRYPFACPDHDWAGMTGEIIVESTP